MTQTPADPVMPRGKRPRLEPPQVPAQQTLLAPAPGGPKKVKRWPAAVGAGVLGLFIGVGLGASSPRATDTETTAAASGPASTVTVQAPAATVTVLEPLSAALPEGNTAQAVEAASPAKPSGPLTTFSSGTYEVGTGDGQVAPGKYRTTGPDAGDHGSCYWARLKNTNGDFGSIITNGNAEGPTVITISKSDGAFETRCTWTKAG